MFVSRLHPTNRLDLLVEAVKLLEADLPQLVVFVIGKGEEEERQVRTHIDALGIGKRFRFCAVYNELDLRLGF